MQLRENEQLHCVGTDRLPRVLRRPLVFAIATLEPPPSKQGGADKSHRTDVVIVGSGLGGLCCAALLARYGLQASLMHAHSWVLM